MNDKTAKTAYPIQPLIAQRWSPSAMDPERNVSRKVLASLLTAASWAPSSFNEQPWRYLILDRANPQALEKGRACLMEGNAWARRAPVLLLSTARTRFTRNDRPNRHALHDVGAASALLQLEAHAQGLATHQMAGFDADKARADFEIPEEFELVAMIAVGWPGDVKDLPEKRQAYESAPRSRRSLSDFAYENAWEEGWSSHSL